MDNVRTTLERPAVFLRPWKPILAAVAVLLGSFAADGQFATVEE